MLIDTDVFIWYMRGNKKAYAAIENDEDVHISVIAYMELVQGMRNKNELHALRRALKRWNAHLLYINEEISIQGLFLLEYYLSHSLQTADALIAATALSHGLTLLTGNEKHYAMIRNLQLKNFKP
jgi:predicted nucleic acid-binding protein